MEAAGTPVVSKEGRDEASCPTSGPDPWSELPVLPPQQIQSAALGC